MGTPTFLAAYVRKCTKEQFSSLRYVVAGAEKMKTTLSEAFREKFNLTPFEGYGATELSPIVALGVPDYVSDEEKIHQVGHKSGSVGHPIPGVAVKTVDPDTGEVKDYEEEGLLLVKGPNVMIGYLADEVKTQEVLQDGWYRTGDMAKIDKDGFIHITDRLSRFSKIGGEMVPHIRVEEKILEALEAVEPVCAVSAVPDEKKGERLVVLYRGEISVDDLWEKLNASDLPKLWIPKRDDFYRVDEIPLLGSGKLDLKRIKAMASEVSKNNSAEAAT
jgi:acyl-[acyl-carrier-protein]-phospholipid O-acyltransferase/long-chain-fatty-acid--[acyl-carrier-protein] ligase